MTKKKNIPTKPTENGEFELNENQILFLELLPKKGFNISRTCDAININRSTYYDWKAANTDFDDALSHVKEKELDEAEEMHYYLRKGIPRLDANNKFVSWKKEPDRQAIEFFLKTKGKLRGYVEKTEVEQHNTGELTININRT